MPILYQFIFLLPIILFLNGCVAPIDKKTDTPIIDKTITDVALIDTTISSTMTNKEKIQYTEKLFEASLSRNGAKKNPFLINALNICSQVLLSDALLAEDRDYTLQLSKQIITQIDYPSLNGEQKNQFLLTSASIELAENQFSQAMERLSQDFNSTQAELWSQYHKIRAISFYQQGHKVSAIKELIFRQHYIPPSRDGAQSYNTKLENQTLIWKYLNSLNSQEILNSKSDSERISLESAGGTESEQIYIGWLDLADIFRKTNDPQTISYAINFWLQSHPGHQADRVFINHIIQRRQESILKIKHIAILLPLQGKLAKPAKAIRDGIMASHYHSPLADNIVLRFYDTSGNESIQAIHQRAVDNGAEFIIGPLAKNNVGNLLQSTLLETPTLALNDIENPSAQEQSYKSPHLFQFALSPESEARIVAKKGLQDGHQYAAIMIPDSQWGQRMQKAFIQYWQQNGGIVVDTITYPSKEFDFSESIKSLLNIEQSESRKKHLSRTIGRKLEFTPRRRQDIDMLFLAAFPKQAKQIPLQIIYHHGETIPLYSTAHIVADYHNARQNIDLDSVIFSDMPFLLGIAPEATSLQSGLRSILYERLFAMGVDSYQLAPYINYLADNPAESFAGDSGQLSVNNDRQIVRSLPWASFEQGNIRLQESKQNNNSDFNSSPNDATLH